MKIKYKNILILLVVISLVVGGFIYFNKNNNSNKKANNKSDTTKYSTKSIKQIEKLKIKDKIDLNKYSKTLDVAIFSDEYNYNYITYYENTKYFDNDNLISYINKLAKDGFAIGEINELFDNFLSYSNFDINNAKRYTAYKVKNPDLNKQDVVTRVNLNLDKPFYSEAKRVEKQDDMYALVNKYNYVDISYVPSNLKTLVNNSNIKMVDVAADAYKEFVDAGRSSCFCSRPRWRTRERRHERAHSSPSTCPRGFWNAICKTDTIIGKEGTAWSFRATRTACC